MDRDRRGREERRGGPPRADGFRIGRTRLGPVLAVAALAPITAELIQAYLGALGGVVGLVVVVAFLAPLYGGAALLIREISVRTGRGWPGRLLLAAAFGVAMPTLVDASLFTASRPDIDDWDQIVAGASFAGIGWAAAVAWVAGHVLLSISAPLVIVEQLSRARGPWLGRVGLAVTAVLFLLVAGAIHHDVVTTNVVHADAEGYAVSAVVVIGLAAAAMTPLGRPVRRVAGRTAPSPWWCLAVGVVGVGALALAPKSWPGLAIELAVLAAGGLLVLAWSRSPDWGPRHLAGLAFGGVMIQTVFGFVPHFLLLVLVLGVALERRTRER